MEQVYKVVRIRDGKMISCIAADHSRRLVVYYVLGEWMFPEIGKLFAYGTLKSAKHFAIKDPHLLEIWLADATDVTLPTKHIPNLGWREKYVDRYWEDFDRHVEGLPIVCDDDFRTGGNNVYTDAWPTPEGTVLCSSVRLVEVAVSNQDLVSMHFDDIWKGE